MARLLAGFLLAATLTLAAPHAPKLEARQATRSSNVVTRIVSPSANVVTVVASANDAQVTVTAGDVGTTTGSTPPAAASSSAVAQGAADTTAASTSSVAQGDVNAACRALARNISSSSDVFFPYSPSPDFTQAWTTQNSYTNTQIPTCVFEPGNAEDIGVAMRIIGQARIPFAVKSGGHQHIKGFSSTPGLLIQPSRLNQCEYDAASGTALIGPGQTWDGVYSRLDPQGVTVLGGRVSGVGVAGFTTGGGMSFRTNEAGGTTSDTVTEYGLVLPTGEVTTVTADSDPDVFFLLKGGHNSAGIVTSFRMKTLDAPQVWGGINFYPPTATDAVLAACAEFDRTVSDVKSGLLCNYVHTIGSLNIGMNVIASYNGAEPPAGMYDALIAAGPYINTWKTSTSGGVAQASPANFTDGISRVQSNSVTLSRLTPTFMANLKDISDKFALEAALRSIIIFAVNPETFVDGMFRNAVPGLYKHEADKPFRQVEVHIQYLNPADDDYVIDFAQRLVDELGAAAQSEGIELGPIHPNYAPPGIDLEKMYGSDGLARGREIVRRIDPNSVMGLTGGYRLQ